MRLDYLYAKSIAAHDTRTALLAQREMNRHLRLYSRHGPADKEWWKSNSVSVCGS